MRKGLMLILSLLSFAVYAQPETTLKLTSTSFSSLKGIAKTFTCDDKDMSPHLAWQGIPANTKSLALILSDPDAPGGVFYHWVIYNIPPTVTSFDEGKQNIPGTTGKNSFNSMGYNGPCPPKGSTHHYIFTLYALDNLLDLPQESDAKAVLNALQGHIVGQAELKTTFSR